MMDDDDFELSFPPFHPFDLDSDLSKDLFPSTANHSEIPLIRPRKPKNYKQSRLNQKSNFQQLQNRIRIIESQIANEKFKRNYCSRCGKYLGHEESCEIKHPHQYHSDTGREFQKFELPPQIPKLKGQIWIAIGIIMIVIGHLLFGMNGGAESICHSVSWQQQQSILSQMRENPKHETIKMELILSNYDMKKEEISQMEVYADSIVSMIENSKDIGALMPFSHW